MSAKIGIRREDKNQWERRVPIVPGDMEKLIREESLEFAVQPSPVRIFPDQAYMEAGASVKEDLGGCGVVFAVKEIPTALLEEGVTYVFFSHTVKGQPYNMALLRRLLHLRCNLIDYERITDEGNRRLIFFGRHAGLAGMIDTLWSLGQRLEWEGIEPNPFKVVQQTYRYKDLDEVRRTLGEVARQVEREGLPEALLPLIVGFAGYGNVSGGAQEILDCLPVEELPPGEVASFAAGRAADQRKLYKTVFREEHMVKPVEAGKPFDLQEYYSHPDRYSGTFNAYLPHLTVLMNCIYWDTPYPRLVTRECVARLFGEPTPPRLKVVGDLSCDIEGAVEITLKATEPDQPVYVYEPGKDRIRYGVEGKGPVVMAVDNLPCELPVESSRDFSTALLPFVGPIARGDYTGPFESLELPAEIKRALIVYQGVLTPDYKFMEKFIK